jgi:hypothetical protein
VPDQRHSAKSIFFAEYRDLALGEVLKKIQQLFAECQLGGTWQSYYFAECQP